jgi:ribosomal protein S17E
LQKHVSCIFYNLKIAEELRLKLVNLFKKILKKYPNELKPHISDLSKMLGVILKDQFPDIKVAVSQFISELSKEMKNDIGNYAKQIIESLCLNMKHQHNKIRKISTTSLVDLLLCNEAGNLIDECIPSFTIISNDKNKDTRKIFLNKIAELLEKLNSIYLKKYEGKLFVLLLSGISDDDEDNQKLARKLIEEVGENIHKLEMELNKKE